MICFMVFRLELDGCAECVLAGYNLQNVPNPVTGCEIIVSGRGDLTRIYLT